MTTLRQLLVDIADELGDYTEGVPSLSFQQWSQRLLISFINEAFTAVALNKPADFVKPFIFRLQPGVTQQACCKVTGAITEQVDHAGNHIGYIRAITNGSPMRWNKAHCSGEYRVTSTYNAAKSGNSFDVNPPVPKEGAYYVKLQCFSVPAEVGDGDLDSNLNDTRFIPALKQWVLFRALTSSRDGASERTDAARHEKSFYTILGVQYKMEQTIKGDSSVVNAPR